MAEKEKVTTMVLKVDLQCNKCYKKVKRVLCKFPQIRDQIYDEKQNQVVIKVVCCSPEKIRDRICCKGGGAIKCIEIPPAEKPKPLPKPEPVPCYPPPYPVTVNVCCMNCYHGHHDRPCRTRPAPEICCTDCHHGRHGGPCETGFGGIAPYCVARSDCFSEENPQGCTVM